jgi:uncharacterized protein YndB with AHSA1/START domain
MEKPLISDFTIDEVNSAIRVKCEFIAPLPELWKAWTLSELLDQWWAPRPYRTITKSQDLKEGGTWLYHMLSPENEKHWCKADYNRIEPHHLLSWKDAFCDENGIENEGKPRSVWTINFSESGGSTTLDLTVKQESLEDIEQMIRMGYKEEIGRAHV